MRGVPCRIPRSKLDSELLDLLDRLEIADVTSAQYPAIWQEQVGHDVTIIVHVILVCTVWTVLLLLRMVPVTVEISSMSSAHGGSDATCFTLTYDVNTTMIIFFGLDYLFQIISNNNTTYV